MNDVNIVMVDGISNSNINAVVNSFMKRFGSEYDCQSLDLSLEYNTLIDDLKSYITNMDFKNNKYKTNLLEIFTKYATSKKDRMSKITCNYVFTNHYSPFGIMILCYLDIIRKELSKFQLTYQSQHDIKSIMTELYKGIIAIDSEVPGISTIVIPGLFHENVSLSIQRGENDLTVQYPIHLEPMYQEYRTLNTILCENILLLRCPEYRRVEIDRVRLMKEITEPKNIKLLFN